MSTSARWTLAALAVVLALVVALSMQLAENPAPTRGDGPAHARDHRDADTPEALAKPRAEAELPPCPPPGVGAGPASLRGIELECAGDGQMVDVARALSGRAVVLNLWAYWCGPCADELPAMAEYQRRVGDAVTVVTVHQDENETAALLRLAQLGVRLPTLQDGRRLIAAAVEAPNVMPATAVLRPDGSVAGIAPRSFATADDIEEAVDKMIGEPR